MWTAMAKTRDSLESAGTEELAQACEAEFVYVADVGATQHPRVPRPSSKRPAHGSGPEATDMPSGLPPWRRAERFLDKYAQESSVQHCDDTNESEFDSNGVGFADASEGYACDGDDEVADVDVPVEIEPGRCFFKEAEALEALERAWSTYFGHRMSRLARIPLNFPYFEHRVPRRVDYDENTNRFSQCKKEMKLKCDGCQKLIQWNNKVCPLEGGFVNRDMIRYKSGLEVIVLNSVCFNGQGANCVSARHAFPRKQKQKQGNKTTKQHQHNNIKQHKTRRTQKTTHTKTRRRNKL